jgi:hypothetical protein
MDLDPLRRFHASAAELTAHCRAEFEAGHVVADDEIRALSELAESIGRGLVDWRRQMAEITLGRPLDARRAGVLVLESVFDEVLEPCAWRLLSDALALTDLE